MKSKEKILIAIAFTLFTITHLSAQSKQAKEIDGVMQTAFQLGIFNGNVLVIEKGKTVYEASLGYTDASKKTKLNSSYLFNIGSISKEFNAVGIMMLKEQGKLSLDDKVSKYLSDLPAWSDKISIKNLLQYNSGLPDIKWAVVKNDTDIYNGMKKIDTLLFKPGTNYAYNNSNVFLQRRIIEKVSGMPFHTFVEKYMLQPCGMKSSVVDPDMRGSNVAVSFNNELVQSPRQYIYNMTGWTSVTAQDLYTWTQCLHAFKLINKESFREILMPFAPNRQSGLGGGSMDGDVIREHMHHGSSADFEAYMYIAPAEEISVILLTNNMNNKVFDIKDAIYNILKGKPYRMPKKSLLAVLRKTLDTDTIDDILAKYNHLKATQAKDFNFESEDDLNMLGYTLMNKKRLDDAIKIFELNVKLFPQSGNVYDSLGEAYLNKGNNELALLNYKKALALDPANKGAKDIIEKLEK
ncbi:serine hydrolase domain-containing protein [Emticicia sp. BO119]|uniref:serine hydrolase domain-containing protein n=1 Tax=Emticicia sp. BO119 TaxID=2757768 RepID=UPI0015F01943|nr:serine hydrolase domain-containing protein [Emticicia sp. BO119]MBA4852861.1 serine hydrolase [Emticicia sp. BO119]